ncbi:hypothetical protein EDB89DRAFT_950241 [Lactarius sanguifluus]|nr:hypothetical protein EDB89DRAFT_950241 [Lactarius sanguifluus]
MPIPTRHRSPICPNNTLRTARHHSAVASTTRRRMGTPCQGTHACLMAQTLAVSIPFQCHPPAQQMIMPRRPGTHRKTLCCNLFYFVVVGIKFVDILTDIRPLARHSLCFCVPPTSTSAPVSRSPAHFILRIFTAKLCVCSRHSVSLFFLAVFLFLLFSIPFPFFARALRPPHTLFVLQYVVSRRFTFVSHTHFLDRRTLKIDYFPSLFPPLSVHFSVFVARMSPLLVLSCLRLHLSFFFRTSCMLTHTHICLVFSQVAAADAAA